MSPGVAEKGTLILLHGLLPHRSGPNPSAKRRDADTLRVQRSPDLPRRGVA